MDNTYLYYSPAEIEYRRKRAQSSLRRAKRRRGRGSWRRDHTGESI